MKTAPVNNIKEPDYYKNNKVVQQIKCVKCNAIFNVSLDVQRLECPSCNYLYDKTKKLLLS